MFPSEQTPRTLDGFEILQRLGKGGAGDVFLARSRGGKLVAIKTISGATRDSGSSADSFAREASVCARLSHPCIAQVRAFIEEPGFAALVYEYVPGVSLGRVMRLCQSRGVRLPDRASWYIVEQVLRALAYAHQFRDSNGKTTPIVHRDVSPSNVLLDWNGGVKIADFGIAKMLGVSPSTRIGTVKGTPGCMAPEQARGEAVDERADVYAASLLAWRLATGRGPFAKYQKDEFELLRAMRNPRITPLGVLRPDAPEPLLDAIARALEPEVVRRTITAGALADAICSNADVEAGRRELADLLGQWKPALERAPQAGDTAGDSSTGRIEQTLRYDEVALLFDDDASSDGPTFESHALPSDPAVLAALPLPDASRLAKTIPPARPVAIEMRRARPASKWPVVAALFAIAFVIAAGIAALAR